MGRSLTQVSFSKLAGCSATMILRLKSGFIDFITASHNILKALAPFSEESKTKLYLILSPDDVWS